jgi:hypothetical protein
MQTTVLVVQMIVALTLLNVWLLRFRQSTAYRGGNAQSMPQEFAVYGLPSWFTYVIGALKIGTALVLIAGLWFPAVVFPAAVLISLLMLGALAMHLKVHDPVKKFLPAFAMLLMGVFLCFNSIR